MAKLLGGKYTRKMDRETHTSRRTVAEKDAWGSRLLPHTGSVRTRVFPIYLIKMSKVRSPTCLYCGAEKDDAKHTFFDCDRWSADRRLLEDAVGHISPESMVQVMLDKHENWALVSRFAEEILRTKKGDLDNQTTPEDPPGLPS